MASISLLQVPSTALFLSHAPPHMLNGIAIRGAEFRYADCLRPDRRTVTPYGAQRRLLSRNKIAKSEATHMPSARSVRIRSHGASGSHVDHSGPPTTSTTRYSASADSSGGLHVPGANSGDGGDESNENINGVDESLRSLPGAQAPNSIEPSSKMGSLPLLNASLTSLQRPQALVKLQRAIADWWSRSNVANRGMPAVLSLALVFVLATSAPASEAFIQAPPRKLQADEEHTVQLFRDNTPSVVYITNLAVRRDVFTMDEMAVPQGSGSGFIWDTRGHVVTNFHVIRGASDLRELYDNLLSGSIPSAVGSLSSLSVINLSGNQFSGNLSSLSFSALTALYQLDLHNNSFSGRIPHSIGSLKKLVLLNLAQNSFGGEVPLTFGHLVNLQSMDLSGNNLSGPLPVALGGLTDLQNLNLSNNNFGGPIGDVAPLTLITLNISFNLFEGPIPSSFFLLSNLQSLDMQSCGVNGSIPHSSPSLPKLNFINLSNNSLWGEIPETFNSASLRYLNLSYNQLVGSIPFPPPTNNSTMDLSNNYLSSISFPPPTHQQPTPPNQLCSPVTAFNVLHNCLLDRSYFRNLCLPQDQHSTAVCVAFCGTTSQSGTCSGKGFCFLNATSPVCACTPPFRSSGPSCGVAEIEDGVSNPMLTTSVIVAIAVTSILGVSLFIILAFCVCKQRRVTANGGLRKSSTKNLQSISRARTLSHALTLHERGEIKLAAILEATYNFSPLNVIGAGASCHVYRGVAADGTEWAVKRAKRVMREDHTEFVREIKALSRIHHANLVRLLGFCCENEEEILVYELVPNGTLAERLDLEREDSPTVPRLTFENRLDIAVGAGQALVYLHSHTTPPIIHRDLKPANIFLDRTLNVKVGDFGLLQEADGADGVGGDAKVQGTMGYMDPEYFETNVATTKSDVYSFGVVLLELITGRKAVFSGGDAGLVNLRVWALPYIENGNLAAIVDPQLEGIFGVEQMRDLANIAAQCLAESSGNRPDMRQVVTLLGGIATMHCLDDAHRLIASENLDGGSDIRSSLTGLSVSWSDSV